MSAALERERSAHQQAQAALTQANARIADLAAQARQQATLETRVVTIERERNSALADATSAAAKIAELTAQAVAATNATRQEATLSRELETARTAADQVRSELARTKEQLTALNGRRNTAGDRATHRAAEVETGRRDLAALTTKALVESSTRAHEVRTLQEKLSDAQVQLIPRASGRGRQPPRNLNPSISRGGF